MQGLLFYNTFEIVKNFRQQQRPKKSSLVIGREAVINALKGEQQLDRIYIDNRAQGNDIGEIRKLAGLGAVPINYVPTAKLNAFNVADHEGCIALKSKVQYQELQSVISWITEKGESPLFFDTGWNNRHPKYWRYSPYSLLLRR